MFDLQPIGIALPLSCFLPSSSGNAFCVSFAASSLMPGTAPSVAALCRLAALAGAAGINESIDIQFLDELMKDMGGGVRLRNRDVEAGERGLDGCLLFRRLFR
jgi:hypothetical protein